MRKNIDFLSRSLPDDFSEVRMPMATSQGQFLQDDIRSFLSTSLQSSRESENRCATAYRDYNP